MCYTVALEFEVYSILFNSNLTMSTILPWQTVEQKVSKCVKDLETFKNWPNPCNIFFKKQILTFNQKYFNMNLSDKQLKSQNKHFWYFEENKQEWKRSWALI